MYVYVNLFGYDKANWDTEVQRREPCFLEQQQQVVKNLYIAICIICVVVVVKCM